MRKDDASEFHSGVVTDPGRHYALSGASIEDAHNLNDSKGFNYLLLKITSMG